MPTQHVLIVGAGLAGPCLALSLARHNIRSTIFEIRLSRSNSGGSLSLGPNALHVLDRYANVYESIKSAGYTYTRFGAYTDDGEKLGEIAVTDEKKGAEGYPAVRIMRSKVHDVLLDAVEETKGLIEVKWGAKIRRIAEDNDGVTAYFEDGSEARGDILIGADGVHSKVREHVLGDSAPLAIFGGTCVVNGFLPTSAAQTPPHFTFPAFMFTPSGMFMTVPIDPEGKQLTWGISRQTEPHTRDEWRDLELSGQAARSAKADLAYIHAEPVRSLLDEADETSARVYAPYCVPDLPRWHTSRVCLIGDSAHGLPPNGQGSALAFEDAAILQRLVLARGDKSYDSMFSHFESLRRPRIEALKTQTVKSLQAKSGPWIWYAKKWAFRAFFWWKGGVLAFTLDEKFDVESAAVDW